MCPSRYVPSPEMRVVISLLDVGAKIVCDKYYDRATHVASEFLDAHIRARYLANRGATFSMVAASESKKLQSVRSDCRNQTTSSFSPVIDRRYGATDDRRNGAILKR